MATRLMSGNVQARQVGNVPMQQISQQQTNYTIAANVQAQEAGTLAQILNDMRATVLEFSGKQRMREGLQYVADNPVTKEQIDLAIGGIISPTLGGGIGKRSGDLSSFFNQAVQEARSAELTNHFLIEGKTVLSRLLNNLENNRHGVTPESIKTEITSVTKGLSKALSAVDPTAAIKLQASMATHGNAVLNAAYEFQLKKNKELNEIKFYGSIEDDKKRLKDVIKNGATVDPKTNLPITVDDRLNQIREETLSAAITLGDANIYKEHLGKIDGFILNAKINVISEHLLGDKFLNDPSKTLTDIRDRTIDKYGDLLKTLDSDSIKKITADFMIASNTREELKRNKRDEEKRNGEAAAIDLLEKIFAFKNKNDPTRIAYVKDLLALPPGSTPIGTLKDVLEPEKAAEGNANTAYNAYNAIQKNIIKNIEDLDKISGLSPEQRLALAKEFYKKDKEDSRILTRTINELSGLPTDENVYINLNPDSSQFKSKVKLEADAERIRSEAEAKGQILKGSQIANLLKQEVIARRSSIEAKQAQELLDNYAIGRDGKPKKGREWIPGPVNKNTLGALREVAKKIKDPEERRRAANQILEIESLIEKAEGNK